MYTDGACKGNPGPGGWGVLLRWEGHEKELSGGVSHTTNNRMEITAAIKGFEALKKPFHVIVVTDSTYLKNGMTRWLPEWQKREWQTAQKKPVQNVDLWMHLHQIVAPYTVEWQWVAAHKGHPENERVDVLAKNAIKNPSKKAL